MPYLVRLNVGIQKASEPVDFPQLVVDFTSHANYIEYQSTNFKTLVSQINHILCHGLMVDETLGCLFRDTISDPTHTAPIDLVAAIVTHATR